MGRRVMNKIGLTLLLLTNLLVFNTSCQNYWWSHRCCGDVVEPEIGCVEYGLLYNWWVTEGTGDNSITSSDDWDVPTIAQWDALVTYVGGTTVAGGKLKETGTTYWSSPNTGATNEYGFYGRGAGVRNTDGTFASFQTRNEIWSQTEYGFNPDNGEHIYLDYNSAISTTPTGGHDKNYGHSIRLVADATGLADGTATTYTGNDGQQYNAIVINELYWLTENLIETQYRDGSSISEVTDNTEWSNLSAGAYCAYDNDWDNVGCITSPPLVAGCVEYGLLYNWYAVDDERNIANDGWSVPSDTDFNTLSSFLGGDGLAGGKLKETGIVYWSDPNVDASNTTLFYGRGSGVRNNLGEFSSLGANCYLMTVNGSGSYGYSRRMVSTNDDFSYIANLKEYGLTIRLIKDETTLSDGETGTYIGNNGVVYNTICIGTQEWLAENLVETEYANGDLIPEVTDGATWTGLSTGALCAYNNDWDNAGCIDGVDDPVINEPLAEGCVEYGLLYNWYAATDAREISSSDDWVVASISDYQSMADFLGAGGDYVSNNVAGKIKDTSLEYWANPNSGATNSTNFGVRGNGVFTPFLGGNFVYKDSIAYLLTSSEFNSSNHYGVLIHYNDSILDCDTGSSFAKMGGYGIRLRKTSTTLSDGQYGTYTGNNGVVYNTVCIDTIEWLAENLVETYFRDGSPIPYVQSLSQWATTTTAAMIPYDDDWDNVGCIGATTPGVPFITEGCVEYGLLYNWYTITNESNIANDGWHVMTLDESINLYNYLSGQSLTKGNLPIGSATPNDAIARKLRLTGTDYWDTPNDVATDEYGFGAKGSGGRLPAGAYGGLTNSSPIWVYDATYTRYYFNILYYPESSVDGIHISQADNEKYGFSVCLVKDETELSDGEVGNYQGNDGTLYTTIVVDGVEYVLYIAETQYRDGTYIPENYSSLDWSTASSGAWSVYDGDYENVGCDFAAICYLDGFSYSNQYNVSHNNLRGLYFSNDGTKMFLVTDTKYVREYNVSTAWDLGSTVTYFTSKELISSSGDYWGLFFSPDGYNMYVADNAGKKIDRYILSTAWSLVGGSVYHSSLDVSGVSGVFSPHGVVLDNTGNYMIISGEDEGDEFQLRKYYLPTAYSFASAVLQETQGTGFTNLLPDLILSPDGRRLFFHQITNALQEQRLNPPLDISPVSINCLFETQLVFPYGLYIKSDFTRLYIATDYNDYIMEYSK